MVSFNAFESVKFKVLHKVSYGRGGWGSDRRSDVPEGSRQPESGADPRRWEPRFRLRASGQIPWSDGHGGLSFCSGVALCSGPTASAQGSRPCSRLAAREHLQARGASPRWRLCLWWGKKEHACRYNRPRTNQVSGAAPICTGQILSSLPQHLVGTLNNRRNFTCVDAETVSWSAAEESTQPALRSLLRWILRALVVFTVLCRLLWKLPSPLAFHGRLRKLGSSHTVTSASHAPRLFPIKRCFFQPSRYFLLG